MRKNNLRLGYLPVELRFREVVVKIRSQDSEGGLNVKRCAVVLILIGLVAGFTLTSFASDDLVEIRFLTQASPAGEQYAKVFAELEEYGYKVIVEQVPWVTYLEKAQLAIQSRVSPYDVINANVEWILPSYVAGEKVFPLNQFMDKDAIGLDDFLPITLDNVFWPPFEKNKPKGVYDEWENGLLFGIPSLSDSTPLTYRKDWFEEAGIMEPPKNWDEFLEVAKKMTQDLDGDGIPDRYGFAFAALPEGGNLTDYWMMFIYSWGADLLDENFMPAFNNPKGIAATQFMVDLLHKHKVVPPGVLTYGIPEAFDAYKKGITAMTTQWGYALTSVEDPDESLAAGKSGYAAPPFGERIGARFAQWAYTIPRAARDPEVSWQFIRLISSPEIQSKLLPNVPPSLIQVADEIAQDYPGTYLVGLMETISANEISIKPQIPNILELDAAIAYPIYEALAGRTSVEQALAEAEKAAIEVLRKGNLIK